MRCNFAVVGASDTRKLVNSGQIFYMPRTKRRSIALRVRVVIVRISNMQKRLASSSEEPVPCFSSPMIVNRDFLALEPELAYSLERA